MTMLNLKSYLFLSKVDKAKFESIGSILDKIIFELEYTKYREIDIFSIDKSHPLAWQDIFNSKEDQMDYVDRLYLEKSEECEIYFRLGRHTITSFVKSLRLFRITSLELALYTRDYLIEMLSLKLQGFNLSNYYICSAIQGSNEAKDLHLELYLYNIDKVSSYYPCNPFREEISNIKYNLLSIADGDYKYSKSIII